MEHPMYEHTVQLFFVGHAKLFGIARYCLKADKDVSCDEFRAFAGGIEGEDVGVVVMIEEELVGL